MDTLLLNQHYAPLRVVSWRKAFSLVVSGRAEYVESYTGKSVRSANRSYDYPSVVRYLVGGDSKFRKSRLTRAALWARDKGVCVYCKKSLSKMAVTKDHVMPRSRGGGSGWDNIVVSCRDCNNTKGNRTPEEAGLRLPYKPYRPKFLTNFAVPKVWKSYLW